MTTTENKPANESTYNTKESKVNGIHIGSDNKIYIESNELDTHLMDFGSPIVFSWRKKDKVMIRREVPADELVDLIETVVNNEYKDWLGDCDSFSAFAPLDDNPGQSVTLVEIRLRGIRNKKPAAKVYDNAKDHGNNKSLVALMAAINEARSGHNKEDSMSTTSVNSKPSLITRSWNWIVRLVKKIGRGINTMARSFMGWHADQVAGILGSISVMVGGMFFWILMGGNIGFFWLIPLYTMAGLWLNLVLTWAIAGYVAYCMVYSIAMLGAMAFRKGKAVATAPMGVSLNAHSALHGTV